MSAAVDTVAAPKKTSIADEIDDLVAPASKKGQQETDDKLEIYRPTEFAIEKARRASTKESDINFLYCLVFQEKEVKPSGLVADLKANFFEPKFTTQAELEKNRHEICTAIEEAGFVVETVYNSTKDKVIVKVGCNDDRLFREAELSEHKLECNQKSLKHILELKIKDINPDAEVDKPKHKVYLDYANYTQEEFDMIQAQGGEGTLPIFRLRDRFHGSKLTNDPISLEIARKTFEAQCSWHPFKHIHMKYDAEWEEKIIEEHNVQLYKTYLDGTILRTADRIDLIQQALEREVAKRQGIRGAGLDLDKLQYKKTILAHFPIQYSSQIRKAKDLTPKQIFRKFKMETPCCTSRLFLPFQQPVQDIRDYCGEKIAYYFAFLEFYSLWLTFSAVIGFVIFLAQLGRLSNQTGEADIVTQPAVVRNISLQPLFDDLGVDGSNVTDDEITDFVRAQDFVTPRTPFAVSINRDKVLYLSTPTEIPYVIAIYSVIIALWAAFFLEFWKRRQATLAFRWGVSDYEKEAQIRPEFISKYDVPDAVTGLPTPYRSVYGFGIRLGLSFSLVGTLVALTIAAFAATYVFKAFMAQSKSIDPTVAVQTALVLNAVVIFVLGSVFKSVGKKLTDWENHRTDIEYEDQLIGKTFIFTFFNSYTTLIYFAFLKSGTVLIGQNQYCVAELQDFEVLDAKDLAESTDPADHVFKSEDLFKVDSCYGALGYSLIIIFATQILLNNFQEIGIPMISQFVKKYFYQKAFLRTQEFGKKMGHEVQGFGQNLAQGDVGAAFRGEHKAEDPDDVAAAALKNELRLKSPAETQFLLAPYNTPFADYLELALQFGYVTLFVAAFPLAPFLALLNNFIEVWVDASKVCLLSRRPLVKRAQDIGTWLKVFEILSYVAIITNAAVLCFTSVELVPLSTETQGESKVWAFLSFIIAVFAVKYITDFFISDTPANVTAMLRRQQFIENKIFFDSEDDTEKMIVMIDKDKKKEDEQDMEQFRRYEPLNQDPYMNEIVDEVRDKMKAKGISQDDLFATIDINNSDLINLNELKKALLRTDIGIGEEVDEPIVTMFVQALDIDGDGHISKQELAQFLAEGAAPVQEV